MFPLPLHIYFEIAAFIASGICWTKIKSGKFRWFLPFLLLMVIVELTGRYLRRELGLDTNAYIYNFSVPIEYIFYSWLFMKTYQSKLLQKIAQFFIYAFILFCLLIFILKGIHQFKSIILLIGNISAILFCCLYFYELLVVEERINLVKEPMFWISTGIFLFNLGEFLYSAFFKLLRQQGWDNGTKLFKAINNNLILVLYLCIIIGLLCVKTYKGYKATFVQ
jgi:hypothetical protein